MIPSFTLVLSTPPLPPPPLALPPLQTHTGSLPPGPQWWFFRESLLYLQNVQHHALWLLFFLALLPWYYTVFRYPTACVQLPYKVVSVKGLLGGGYTNHPGGAGGAPCHTSPSPGKLG